MTFTPSTRQVASSGVPAGAASLVLYLALCAAPLGIALAGPTPPGRDFRTELAAGLGFLALAVMCLQFVLTARFRRLKAPYGSDLVYAFHRDITFVVLAFAAAHPVLLWFTPQREGEVGLSYAVSRALTLLGGCHRAPQPGRSWLFRLPRGFCPGSRPG